MTNINFAFSQFEKEYTTLDTEESRKAKSSQNWLLDRMRNFDGKDFLDLHEPFNMPYGSFARKTKIPELDDIDMMVGINGDGCSYDEFASWNDIRISVGTDRDDLVNLCHDSTSMLNSRKVINRFVVKLSEVPHYSEADIHRNGEACTLKLLSYTWNFDIVPCFFTKPNAFGTTFYIIPNADGNWMKTDPRIDKNRIERIDKENAGHVLPILRLIKFWQRRGTMPYLSSYLLEAICLDYFEVLRMHGMYFPDIFLADLFLHISIAILGAVADPKGIVNNINDTLRNDREFISAKAREDYNLANQARACEASGDMRGCFAAWGKIFGPSFPKYF